MAHAAKAPAAADADLKALWRELGIDPALIRQRRLPRHAEARELVVAEVHRSGRPIFLQPEAAAAWRALKAAAQADGVALYLISGFRSVARQAELLRAKRAQGQALGQILRLLAPPGCSEHHSGRAVDIGAPGYAGLDTAFEHSAAFGWLWRRGGRFGFALSYPRDNAWGYSYEPWHWCHTPAGGRPA